MFSKKVEVEAFEAHGHPNITALHRITLEVTKERRLSPKGTCIVAVGAEKGAADLSPSFKESVRMGGIVTLRLSVGGMAFEVHGMGTKGLELSHTTDIVCRKSAYACPRTLMVKADAAAFNIPRPMVQLLKDERKTVKVALMVIL